MWIVNLLKKSNVAKRDVFSYRKRYASWTNRDLTVTPLIIGLYLTFLYNTNYSFVSYFFISP